MPPWEGKNAQVGSAKMVACKDLKPAFLRNLRTMNITASSLFHGLEGLGKSMDEMVLMETEKQK
jgi:hypothetical protein